MNKERIDGVVERITYADEEKGFSVIKVRATGYREPVTVVGNISGINIGSVISVQGKWSINKKFGRQFNAVYWEESLPADIYGIEKYLGSGLIKGIGPKFAKMIVNTFGAETFNIIEREPQRLLEIPKLEKKKAETIVKSWNEQKDIKNLMMFLQNSGVGASFGKKIFKIYGTQSIEKIKENPYRLVDEVYGVGFKTADAIAQSLGYDKESYNRCRAGVFYILEYLANSEGHCYIPFGELVIRCSKILEIEDCQIVITCDELINNSELICDGEDKKVYLPAFYKCEIGVAHKIKSISEFPRFEKYSDEKIESEISKAEKNNKIKYDDSQRDAIKTAITSNFSVITGGAGVGKTTITKAIIDIFRNRTKKVILTAPTGRAAKRMSEMSRMESKTIHRLLEAQKPGGFAKNAENKLTCDVLIVDESSMVDIVLMNSLLRAIADNVTVILIGDANQLPSVGPGNVLKYIINSGIVPVIKLSKIYRQAKISKIIINSHKINDGKMPDLNTKQDSDFFFIEENNQEKAAKIILDLCEERLPRYYKVDKISDIQVLTPMKKGTLGTDNLNSLLQSKLNKSCVCLKRGATEYRLGDKVMQIKNNYDKDIFNGDIGTICSIDESSESLEIDFDSRMLKYDISELEEITLSYASTVHKAQGGEYPIVVMPVTNAHFIMLERNLFYTAVTRTKKALILVGEKLAIANSVKKSVSKSRYTFLAQRMKNLDIL